MNDCPDPPQVRRLNFNRNHQTPQFEPQATSVQVRSKRTATESVEQSARQGAPTEPEGLNRSYNSSGALYQPNPESASESNGHFFPPNYYNYNGWNPYWHWYYNHYLPSFHRSNPSTPSRTAANPVVTPPPRAAAATPGTGATTTTTTVEEEEGEEDPIDLTPRRRILEPPKHRPLSTYHLKRNLYYSKLKEKSGMEAEQAFMDVIWDETKDKNNGTPKARKIDVLLLVNCLWKLLVFLYGCGTAPGRKLHSVGEAFSKAFLILLKEYFPESTKAQHIKDMKKLIRTEYMPAWRYLKTIDTDPEGGMNLGVLDNLRKNAEGLGKNEYGLFPSSSAVKNEARSLESYAEVCGMKLIERETDVGTAYYFPFDNMLRQQLKATGLIKYAACDNPNEHNPVMLAPTMDGAVLTDNYSQFTGGMRDIDARCIDILSEDLEKFVMDFQSPRHCIVYFTILGKDSKDAYNTGVCKEFLDWISKKPFVLPAGMDMEGDMQPEMRNFCVTTPQDMKSHWVTTGLGGASSVCFCLCCATHRNDKANYKVGDLMCDRCKKHDDITCCYCVPVQLKDGKKFHISDADKDPLNAQFELAKDKGYPEGWSCSVRGSRGTTYRIQKPGFHITPKNLKTRLQFTNHLHAICDMLEEGQQKCDLNVLKEGVRMLIDRKPTGRKKNRFGDKLIEWSRANPDLYRSALNAIEQDHLKVKKEKVWYEFDDLDCYDEVGENDCCNEEDDCEIWEPHPPLIHTASKTGAYKAGVSKAGVSKAGVSKTGAAKAVAAKAAAAKAAIEEEDDDLCEIWELNHPVTHTVVESSKAASSKAAASKTVSSKAAAAGTLKDATNGQHYFTASTMKKRTKPSESGKGAKKARVSSVQHDVIVLMEDSDEEGEHEGKTSDDAIELE